MARNITSEGPVIRLRRARRAAALASTALTACIAAQAAYAQGLAPETTPQGGNVVGGTASLSQSVGNLTINQSSHNAAIDYQSFNLGAAASVDINAPAGGNTLNRVVGPSPSEIAGHISDPNGNFYLINQSGVVFDKGSEVNAQAIVVSTSGINTKDFMAGNMVFSGAPNSGAKIVNDGNLTARQAGLVGLVAPQVLNNGVITAQLGQVQLAAGSAFVLDLYGDRLISLDVTQAVRAVDLNGQIVPALVTNRGLILADGGKIVLTARDADSLVTQLIDAGGTLRANTAGGSTGSILLQGVGGNISIAGNLLAQGNAAGAKGGTVEALADGAVSAASGAVIDASGAAGGGVVALGTDIARARQGAADSAAPVAASVTVAQGAAIKADATSLGNAGTVTLLSAKNTDFAGSISVQGGPAGGNGGLAEISSYGVISLSGTVFDTAINGQAGEVLLDPQTLVVQSGQSPAASFSSSGSTTTFGTDNTTTSYVDPAALRSLSGTIVLTATTLVSVANAITLVNANALTVASGKDVSIEAGITLGGSLEVSAAGSIDIGGALSASNVALLDAGNHTIGVNSSITAASLEVLAKLITLGSAGALDVTQLTGSLSGDALLGGSLSNLGTLGSFTAETLVLGDAGSLAIAGPVSLGGDLTLATGGAVTELAGGSVTAVSLTTGGGSINGNALLLGSTNSIGTLGAITLAGGDTLALVDTGSLDVAGTATAGAITLGAPTIGLAVAGAALDANDVALAANTLNGDYAGSAVTLALAPFSGTDMLVGGAGSTGTLGISAAFLTALPAGVTELQLGEAGGYGASILYIAAHRAIPTFAPRRASVTESTGGSIDAAQLSASLSGGATLGNVNVITELGPVQAGGGFLLNDTGSAITIASSFTAPSATLTATAITIGAPVSLSGALDFTGDIVEPGSFGITAAALTQAAGDTTIGLGGANSIGSIGGLTASGGILLNDAGAVTLAGAISTASTLSLEGGSFTGSLALAAAQLDSGGTILGALTDFSGSNRIGTLGAMTLSGALGLADSGSLSIAGAISASSIGLLLGSTPVLAFGSTPVLDAPVVGISAASGIAIDLGGTSVSGLQLAGSLASALGSNVTLAELATGGTGSIVAEGTLSFTVPTLALESANGIVQPNAADTLTGANITLAGGAGAVNLNGGLSGTDLFLGGAGASAAGAITLTGGLTGSLAGTAALVNSANSIGTLAAFSVSTGDLTLDNGVSLTAAGPVGVAGNVTLANAAPILITGGVSAGHDLELDTSSGSVLESGGSIAAGTLSGSLAGGATLDNAANSIGTLGSFTVPGAASNIDLANAGTLVINGGVTAGNAITLSTGGAVTETTLAAVSAQSLTTGTGTIGGDFLFNRLTTSIAELDNFNVLSGHVFELYDGNSLSIDGLLNAPNGSVILADSAAGGVVANATFGSIVTGTLATGGAGITGPADLFGANDFGTLGSFNGGGLVVLDDTASSLNITGPVTGTLVGIQANSIIVSGLVSASIELALAGTLGGISETGTGTISAIIFSSGNDTIGGDALLTGSANSIGTLGGVTLASGGAFALDDTTALTIASPLAVPNGLVSIRDTSALALGSTITAGAVTLATPTLSLSGGLAATTAVLLFNQSQGSISGTEATLALAPFTTGTNFTVSGTYSGPSLLEIGQGAGSAASNVVVNGLSFSGATLALDPTHNITIASGTALSAQDIAFSGTSLEVDGAISGTTLGLAIAGAANEGAAGSITATLLAGSIGGNASFAKAANAIGTLGAITLASGSELSLADALGLDIAGWLNAPSGTVILQGAGGVQEHGAGSISTGTLSTGAGSIAGNVSLGGANSIATLAGFTLGAGSALALNDAGSLSITGAVAAPAAITLTGGPVTEAGGSITSASFTTGAGSISGALALTGGNSLASFSTVSATGAITLANTGPLAAHSVTGTAITIASTGALTAGGMSAGDITLGTGSSLVLDGLVSASSNVALDAAAGISAASGGLIDAALLTGGNSGSGNVTLANANSITALGNFSLASGALTLNDAAPLTITGAVTVPGLFTLNDTGGSVLENGGAILGGGTFGGSISGGLSLGGANALAVASGITAGGNITLANTGALTAQSITGGNVAIAVTGGALSATAVHGSAVQLAGAGVTASGISASGGDVAIGSSGSILLSGNLSASNAVTLDSATGVTQNAGSITAALLTGANTASGNVSLGGANSITTLGNYTLAGAASHFALNDVVPAGLTVANGTLAAAFITLSAPGLSVAGTGEISASSLLTLAVSSFISGAGIVDAATLNSAPVSGDVSLGNSGNVIGAITGLSAANITLGHSGALDISGNVSAASVLSLSGSGNVFESTGSITASLLTGTLGTGSQLALNNLNNVSSLANITAPAGVSFIDAGPLTAQNVQAGSAAVFLSAAGLTAHGIGGAGIGLDAGSGALDAGSISGTSIALTGGSITLDDDITGTGPLALQSSGAVVQSFGSITTPELDGAAASVSFTDAGNSIGAIGSLAASNAVDILGVGGITQGLTASSATLVSSGDFGLAGSNTLNGGLLITAADNLTQTAGNVNAGTATLTATSGAVSLSGNGFISGTANITGTNITNRGTLRAASATLTATNGDISLSGTESFATALDVIAPHGNVFQTLGVLDAGMLTGVAGTDALFSGTDQINTIGSFLLQDSLFSLSNTGALTIIGPLVANVIDISAGGEIYLANGGAIFLGNTLGTAGESTIAVSGTTGAGIAENGLFELGIDTGTGTVPSFGTLYNGTIAADATLLLQTGNGLISFASSPGGLAAPNLNLVINAGSLGVAEGNVNLRNLTITGAKSTDFTGFLNGLTGQVAAGQGKAYPFPTAQYQFNACPISSVNCTIIAVESVPAGNPLENFDITTRKRRRLDHNVKLPGVAAHDF